MDFGDLRPNQIHVVQHPLGRGRKGVSQTDRARQIAMRPLQCCGVFIQTREDGFLGMLGMRSERSCRGFVQDENRGRTGALDLLYNRFNFGPSDRNGKQ
jgi:hypothetical protein